MHTLFACYHSLSSSRRDIGLDYMTCTRKTALSGVMEPLWITLHGIRANLTTIGEKIVWLHITMVPTTLTSRGGMTSAAKTRNPTSAADLSSPKSLPMVPIYQIIWLEQRDLTSAKDQSSPKSIPKSPPLIIFSYSITHIHHVRIMPL